MSEDDTTAAVERYLDELRGNSPAEPIDRALLDRVVRRLYLLCATLLYRSDPRMTRPTLSVHVDELVGTVADRLHNAVLEARPESVRQFFALADEHIRSELNDLARRLDDQAAAVQLCEGNAGSPVSSVSVPIPDSRRILQAISELPEDEREAFDLVRVQGMTHSEAAQVLGISALTVKQRLNRGLQLLTEQLADLRPCQDPADSS
jgi:RNA polymerase sigma-70 factor (ECF subfamily)